MVFEDITSAAANVPVLWNISASRPTDISDEPAASVLGYKSYSSALKMDVAFSSESCVHIYIINMASLPGWQ
jgi:hypothetical protein